MTTVGRAAGLPNNLQRFLLSLMKNIVLLGAGFSRIWGGWLANEAFEFLLGDPEVRSDSGLRQLLWRYRDQGGFENALAELQQSLRTSTDRNSIGNTGGNFLIRAQAIALQSAITRMFLAMNNAYNEQSEMSDRWIEFLSKFDAIFSLNQDMLLERLYVRMLTISLPSHGKWSGAILPGMQRGQKIGRSEGVEFWSEFRWSPSAKSEFQSYSGAGLQPIYKLHGSSQWYISESDTPVLIIGGAKEHAVGQFEILAWYAKCFENCLETSARLMVIGYGFRDTHINEALVRAGSKGLDLFIVDPKGPSVVLEDNPAATDSLKDFIKERLIGASRRPLEETVLRDRTEFGKLNRFFAD